MESRCFCPPETFFAALGDGAVVAAFHLSDECVRLGDLCRLHNAVAVGFSAECNVLGDRARKEHALLRNVSDLIAQRVLFHVLYVPAVHKHFALGRVVKAGHKVDERGFSAARTPDKGDRLSFFGAEGDMREHVRDGVGVTETHVAEFHGPFLRRGQFRLGIADGDGHVQHFVDALCRHSARGRRMNIMSSIRNAIMT